MNEKKKGPKISLELAVAAQIAYAEQAKKDNKTGGQPSQLSLDSGWGGKGR